MTTHSERALILYRRRRFINHLLTYLLTYLSAYTNDPHLLPDKRNNILLSDVHCRTTLKMNSTWPCTVAATVVLLLFHATCSLSIDGKLVKLLRLSISCCGPFALRQFQLITIACWQSLGI